MTGAMELQPDEIKLEHRAGVRTMQWDLAEGIGKLVGNTLGDRRKKTGRLTARIPEAAELAGVKSWFSLLVKCCNH
ncbi:hypothetical protein GW17_00036329 [Ensete ventricosum]|nr:hypothetical protein GW17_00036329 [Ensete ventricosum]